MDSTVWSNGIEDEVSFWRGVIQSEAATGTTRRKAVPVDHSWVRAQFRPPPPQSVKLTLLDVGCGPFSHNGVAVSSCNVDVVLADALGDRYNELLDQYGFDDFPRILKVRGEDLSEHFGGERFEAVVCANALDHFIDPAVALREMFEVCKRGGQVVVISIENEGVRERYGGLHQWNLQADDEGFWLWNPNMRQNLLQVLGKDIEYSWRYLNHGEHDKVFGIYIRKDP